MKIILFAIIMNESEDLLLQDNDDWEIENNVCDDAVEEMRITLGLITLYTNQRGSSMSSYLPQSFTSTLKPELPSLPSSSDISMPFTTMMPPRGCAATWSVTSKSNDLIFPFFKRTSRFSPYLRLALLP